MFRSIGLELLMVFIGFVGLTFAQNNSASPNHLTSTLNRSVGRRTPPPHHGLRNPNLHDIDTRLGGQMNRIHAALKAGRITKDQAQALRAKVKAIHKQKQDFYKANGRKDLTSGQLDQLKSQIDQNEGSY